MMGRYFWRKDAIKLLRFLEPFNSATAVRGGSGAKSSICKIWFSALFLGAQARDLQHRTSRRDGSEVQWYLSEPTPVCDFLRRFAKSFELVQTASFREDNGVVKFSMTRAPLM